MRTEHFAVGDHEIGEMLTSLTGDCGLEAGSLARLLNVDRETVENGGPQPGSPKRRSFLDRLLMLYLLPDEEPDVKVKAFLEVLLYEHRISAGTVAKFAKLRERDVLDFLEDGGRLPAETKYRLASAVMVLRFLSAAEPGL